MNTRYICVGYTLDDEAIPVPALGELQIAFSVDPWHTAPDGYVIFEHAGHDYLIADEDIARFDVAA